jgi:hypothetical protein
MSTLRHHKRSAIVSIIEVQSGRFRMGKTAFYPLFSLNAAPGLEILALFEPLTEIRYPRGYYPQQFS